MLIIETWVIMVEDGLDCCRSGQPVHKGWWVCSGRRALVQLGLANASLKPALSPATGVEGPLMYTAVF